MKPTSNPDDDAKLLGKATPESRQLSSSEDHPLLIIAHRVQEIEDVRIEHPPSPYKSSVRKSTLGERGHLPAVKTVVWLVQFTSLHPLSVIDHRGMFGKSSEPPSLSLSENDFVTRHRLCC
ncbi:hypothetical protein JTE90_009264 [Oedothorax gibbosus]|uniref:Uncharacterized protein n=1 Tax=Oedothorax gibbosus TaxID=931172 RepID=A0AAV6V2W1_9ARAC|nr:hypothetical protein JTE90_009264 [Oedothorax gibbosus]